MKSVLTKLLLVVMLAGSAMAWDRLEEGLANPPLQARTRTLWWWLAASPASTASGGTRR